MKANKKKQGGIPFTDKDARIFQQVFDVLEDVYGDKAQIYMSGYLRTWLHHCQLTDKGINVTMSHPKYGRAQPLLIIEK